MTHFIEVQYRPNRGEQDGRTQWNINVVQGNVFGCVYFELSDVMHTAISGKRCLSIRWFWYWLSLCVATNDKGITLILETDWLTRTPCAPHHIYFHILDKQPGSSLILYCSLYITQLTSFCEYHLSNNTLILPRKLQSLNQASSNWRKLCIMVEMKEWWCKEVE